eukprot:4577159-Pyramimonas_sp.AAC.2
MPTWPCGYWRPLLGVKGTSAFTDVEENYPALTGGWLVSPRWAAGAPGEPRATISGRILS